MTIMKVRCFGLPAAAVGNRLHSRRFSKPAAAEYAITLPLNQTLLMAQSSLSRFSLEKKACFQKAAYSGRKQA